MIAGVAVAGVSREDRLFAVAAGTVVVVACIYWQTLARMVGMWSLPAYQYGWLVLPVALYLLWARRAELASAPLRVSTGGFAAVCAMVLVWCISRASGVQVLEFAAVSLLPAAMFWAVAGTRALHVVAFPFGVLLAGVPAGEFLVNYLQEITAAMSTALLSLTGVPAYREGMFLTLPGGSFEVAEACGGLRYVLAGAMGALAYAYVSYAVLWKRVLFVMLAAVFMVLTNGIRAFIVMSVASATDMRLLAGHDHVYFGMVLFALAFAGLIWLGERHADRRRHTSVSSRGSAKEAQRISVPAVLAALLCLAIGPVLVRAQMLRPDPSIVTAELPPLAGCRGPGAWQRDWSPEFAGADRIARAGYSCSGYAAGVYLAIYAKQSQGKELVNSLNRVWPHEWRREVQESVVALDAGTGSPNVRQVFVSGADRSRLIWYWYQVGDATFASDLGAKLASVATALNLEPAPASVVAVEVEGPGSADARVLRRWLEPNAEALLAWYRNAAKELRP
jgi:EpsI family protein